MMLAFLVCFIFLSKIIRRGLKQLRVNLVLTFIAAGKTAKWRRTVRMRRQNDLAELMDRPG